MTFFMDLLGFRKNDSRTLSTMSPDTGGNPDPFSLLRKPASFNFWPYVQICIAFGAFFIEFSQRYTLDFCPIEFEHLFSS